MTPTMIPSKVRRICSFLATDKYALKVFQNAIDKGQWYSEWVKVSDSLLQKVPQSLCEVKQIL